MLEIRHQPRVANTRRRIKLLFIVLTIVVPFAIAVLGAEIYLRMTKEYYTPELLRSRSLQYRSSLFARNVFPRTEQQIFDGNGRLQYRVNSLGYRGEPFIPEKPPNVTRLIVYGGSAAFDIGAFDGQDWPRLLEKGLRQSGFSNVQVINAGIPGHATFDVVGRLFAEGHLFAPDYVLLYTEWNDIKDFRGTEPLLRTHIPRSVSNDALEDAVLSYHNVLDQKFSESSQLYNRLRWRYYTFKYNFGPEGSIPEARYGSSLSDTAMRQYRLSVETFVDIARNAGAIPVLVTEARLVSRNNTDKQKERIQYPYVGFTHEALCAAFDVTDRILKEVSDAKDVPLIDISARLSGHDELFLDHVHLTELGSSAVGEAVATAMATLLAAPKTFVPLKP